MSAQLPAEAGNDPVVVGLFDNEAQARAVVDAAHSLGFDNQDCGLLLPGQPLNATQDTQAVSSLLAVTAAASGAEGSSDIASVLLSLGVPEGEARFYADEAHAGRTLVVVNASGRSEEVRKLVLDHGGFDVQSRGAEFIRGDGAGVRGGVGPRPPDITGRWQDFRSRYEMLWQQHYGTTDASWEQMEPIYRYAWELANESRYRGRPWSEVESAVQGDWQRSPHAGAGAWTDLSGPIRDVWEDVAQEALTGAEGGADRRIPASGSDQTVAARDVIPPREGAA